MCLVIAIFFRSIIKIGPHACVWWGTCLNVCFQWSDDIQSRTYFYITLYTYKCHTSWCFQQLYVGSVFMLIIQVFTLKTESFYAEHGMRLTVNRILCSVPCCIKIATLCSIINISIYHKVILTSLATWLLEWSYIYRGNKAFKQDFFVPMHANQLPFIAYSWHPKFVCMQQ
jgi:hypothetical protein